MVGKFTTLPSLNSVPACHAFGHEFFHELPAAAASDPLVSEMPVLAAMVKATAQPEEAVLQVDETVINVKVSAQVKVQVKIPFLRIKESGEVKWPSANGKLIEDVPLLRDNCAWDDYIKKRDTPISK